ncbi:MAG: hypothetical protein JWO05_3620 [Gemmatimonadetes bacterium]|nr:hypothetical protein [Gemmatimonadota bacterium]
MLALLIIAASLQQDAPAVLLGGCFSINPQALENGRNLSSQQVIYGPKGFRAVQDLRLRADPVRSMHMARPFTPFTHF